MGHTFGVKCAQCEYKFEAVVGHGMLWCDFFGTDLDTDAPIYMDYIKDEKILDDINRIIQTEENVRGHVIDKIGYSHGLAQYLCVKCGRLYNKCYFKLVFDDGSYEPEYFCDCCENKLKKVNLENNNKLKWNCPLCGQNKLVNDHNARQIFFD